MNEIEKKIKLKIKIQHFRSCHRMIMNANEQDQEMSEGEIR